MMEKVHFIGVAGSGMSALAQFHVMGGGAATGSDRAFDHGHVSELRAQLEALGVKIFPQDGSALDGGHAYAVTSSALESDNPELVRAKAVGLLVRHRADELAKHVAERRTIAVAGTSGKSTVAAMIFEILDRAGRSPSIITGGELVALKRKGCVGNAFHGTSDLLVVEADESDGTLTRYHPWLGVLLNISKDHKEIEEVRKMCYEFRAHAKELVVHKTAGLKDFEKGSFTFGLGEADLRAEGLGVGAEGSRFAVSGIPFFLTVPGRHNVENALAAAAACRRAGLSLEECSRGLRNFQGVARRFERVGAARGVEVIDDYAHNPVKITAALDAAHLRAERVLAVFQLHGYSPARFLKKEFIDAFSGALRSEDTLWMPEIYYAGGSVVKDVSARDISDAVTAKGKDARFASDRAALVADVVREAKPGNLVLVMGARDPSLPLFARELLKNLSSKNS